MADLENDDDLENEEDDHDLEFECYNYDNNEMYTMYLKNSEWNQVKIDKVKDYYELFVKMLKIEDEKLHTSEHLWVLGIDEAGYSACVYVVTIGYPNFFNVAPTRLFKTALQHNSVKIIIAQSKPDAGKLGVTPTDLELTNLVYHKAEILGLELVDHIVISNSSIKSKKPLYCSHLENGAMCFVQTDMTYKSYKDIEPEIEKAREEFGADKFIEGEAKGKDIGKREEKIDIAKNLLKNNVSIDIIISSTGLSKKDIMKIKKEMGFE